jgi:hypothetical protein
VGSESVSAPRACEALRSDSEVPYDADVDRRRFLLTSLAVSSAWRTLDIPRTFKNQGDSVSFVNTAR